MSTHKLGFALLICLLFHVADSFVPNHPFLGKNWYQELSRPRPRGGRDGEAVGPVARPRDGTSASRAASGSNTVTTCGDAMVRGGNARHLLPLSNSGESVSVNPNSRGFSTNLLPRDGTIGSGITSGSTDGSTSGRTSGSISGSSGAIDSGIISGSGSGRGTGSGNGSGTIASGTSSGGSGTSGSVSGSGSGSSHLQPIMGEAQFKKLPQNPTTNVREGPELTITSLHNKPASPADGIFEAINETAMNYEPSNHCPNKNATFSPQWAELERSHADQNPIDVRENSELANSYLRNRPTSSADGTLEALETAMSYEPTNHCPEKGANINNVRENSELAASELRNRPTSSADGTLEALETAMNYEPTNHCPEKSANINNVRENSELAASELRNRPTLSADGTLEALETAMNYEPTSHCPEIKTNNDPPQVNQRPPAMLRDNHKMPSLTMTDQGSRLWGNFLIWMCLFGVIVANARDIAIWVAATLLLNLNIHPSITISLSDTSSITVTHPFIRIVWNRKLRKPPDKSTEQHWILGELCELLSFLLRHNSLGEPVICTIQQLLSSDVPLQDCGGV